MRVIQLLAAAAAGLVATNAGVAIVMAQEIELKVSHYLPPNHTFHRALTAWGEELDKGSNGKLKLRIYPASQLGPVNRQFELAKNGVADIAVVLHGAIQLERLCRWDAEVFHVGHHQRRRPDARGIGNR